MRQRKLIGQVIQRHVVELDRSDIRRFAGATGSIDQVHYDPMAAKKAGFKDLLAPLAMATTLSNHGGLAQLLEVHPKNILHSEQTVDLRRPLQAGDLIRIVTVVTDVHERPIGSATTGFVTLEDRATDSKGKQLFFARRVLAVRGGFPRR